MLLRSWFAKPCAGFQPERYVQLVPFGNIPPLVYCSDLCISIAYQYLNLGALRADVKKLDYEDGNLEQIPVLYRLAADLSAILIISFSFS